MLQKLPKHNAITIDYNSHQHLSDSIQEIREQLPSSPFSIIGHSLGGVIGASLADIDRLETLVTISSPLGGSKAANFVRWIPGHPPVIEDITPTAPGILQLKKRVRGTRTLCLISTGGHLPTTSEPNDSVVTIQSQRALPYGRKIEIKASHFEILLHDLTVQHIQNHIFGDTE